MYLPYSRWTWAFVMVTLIQAVITLALELYVFANFQIHLNPSADNVSPSKTIPTFLTLYIFGSVYELVLVYDPLRLKNTIQTQKIKEAVDVLMVKHAISGNIWSKTKPFVIVIPCVVALGSVLMTFISWRLYNEFAWTIYRNISSDLRMKRRYLTYQIYIALFKFDFFFFLGFTPQFVVIVTGKRDTEFALTLAAIPVIIIILLIAAFFTRCENTFGMMVIILLYFGATAYFLFKLVRMYQPAEYREYLPVRRSLTFSAVITLILIVMTIINACMCIRNFHKGLKPHLSRRQSSRQGEETMRMIID